MEQPAVAEEVKSSTVATAAADEELELFIGQNIAQDFDSPFEGEVAIVPAKGFKYYRITYEDGDKEDLTYNAVKRYVAYYQRSMEGGSASKRKKHDFGFYEKFPLGTKILKDFSRTFGGKITKLPEGKDEKYTVTYDADGAIRKVTKDEAMEMVAKYKAWIDFSSRLKKEEEDKDANTLTMSETSSTVASLSDMLPLIPPSSSEEENVEEEEEVQLVSDTAPSGLSRVKLEMFGKATSRRVSSNYLERQQRIKARMQALKDPTGAPRKVFRRGCHKACITQVLGGSGTDPSPIVRVPPTNIFEDGINPFIQKGQYYFAGRSDWNPWTPAYPGDVGFIDSQFLSYPAYVKTHGIGWVDRSKQALFHCFLDCAEKKHLPYYLGPNAKGKQLYLGRYRVVPDDEEEVNIIEKIFKFSALEWDSQCTYAEWFVRKNRNLNMDGIVNKKYDVVDTDLAMEVYADAAKTKAENEKEGLWESLRIEKKKERAWVEMLLDNEYTLSIRPVEFVDYDER